VFECLISFGSVPEAPEETLVCPPEHRTCRLSYARWYRSGRRIIYAKSCDKLIRANTPRARASHVKAPVEAAYSKYRRVPHELKSAVSRSWPTLILG
jgi:hypothetical protein